MIRTEYHLYCKKPVDTVKMQLSFLEKFEKSLVDVTPKGRHVIVNIYGHDKTSKKAVSEVAELFECKVE